jgi:hypothetical protein
MEVRALALPQQPQPSLGHHGAGIGQAGESCQAVTAVAKDFNVRTEPAAAAPLASVAEEEQIEQLTRAERRGR